MKCPECGSETRTNELYCRVCGTEIRLTYDQVHDTLSDEIKQDKETATELTMRMMALWMAFFMIVAISFYFHSKTDLIGPEFPETAYNVPVYSSRNEHVRWVPHEDISVDRFGDVVDIIQANKDQLKKSGLGPGKKGPDKKNK